MSGKSPLLLNRQLSPERHKQENEEENNRKLLILYGSETGNCEDLGKRIGWQAKRRHFDVKLMALDEYPKKNLVNEDLVLFICSTTGQGEPPENMKKFWKFIMRKDLSDHSLVALQAAVIGLGDSSYLHYNITAKKLYKRLVQLGASMVLKIVLGDDQNPLGFDATIIPWLKDYWKQVEMMFPLYGNKTVISDDELIESSFEIHFIENSYLVNMNHKKENPYQAFFDYKHPFMATILSNERVTSEDHFQDVRLMKFQIPEVLTSLKYSPGDICVVNPKNLQSNVEEFISLLGLEKDKLIIIRNKNREWLNGCTYNSIEEACSILDLVTNYLDIQSIPKRSFFEIFYHFSQDELEKNKLKEFNSTNGQEDLYEYCNRPRRTILEVLKDFPNTTPHVPFEYLFDLIPSIKPRQFSIASSFNAHPKELHILVAVVKFNTRLKTERLGLCSNWLAGLADGDKVPISIKCGTFRLPPDNIPVICIGPGTGVAPFRSIIQERIIRGVGNNYLIFGCRNKGKDFYFEEEWNDASVSGYLTYKVAYSRDDPAKKHYVQDIVLKEKELMWELVIVQDAWILVAGRANQMPTQVKNNLIEVLEDVGKDAWKGKADKVVNRWERQFKLQFECWS